jgi:1-aminocyclopropane-1-carboxylate deaminase/D-cysteine desulfhydrase-like pyridoxal-dependent ACC family enzyme
MLQADELRRKNDHFEGRSCDPSDALHPVVRFSGAVGGEVWTKGDDLTGFALGGKKARKIEFLLADARAQGETPSSPSAGDSRTTRETVAAAAGAAGMQCHLVLGGDRPPDPTGSNVLLNNLFGTHVHFGRTEDRDVLEKQMQELASDLQARGAKTYAMPVGGSTGVGGLGFVAAWLELADQYRAKRIEPQWIAHATSTGGTQGGLEAAGRMLGADASRALGVSVAKITGELSLEVGLLAADVLTILGAQSDDAPSEILEGYMGPTYGEPHGGEPRGARAIVEGGGHPDRPSVLRQGLAQAGQASTRARATDRVLAHRRDAGTVLRRTTTDAVGRDLIA